MCCAASPTPASGSDDRDPAQPTREVLKFSLAHAQARDAVTTPLDWRPVEERPCRTWASRRGACIARRRAATFICAGLILAVGSSASSRQSLADVRQLRQICFWSIGDGLSSTAIAANAVSFVSALLPYAQKSGWRLGPVLLASEARVALGDDAGEFLEG